MGTPFPVMQSYERFMSDIPRHELPPGVCWDLVNFIPQQDGAARRRYGFASLGSLDYNQIPGSSGVGYTGAFVAYCPFSTVAHEVLAGDSHGEMFSFQEPSLATGQFLSTLPGQVSSRPVWHRDQLVVFPAASESYFYTGRVGGFVAGVGTPKGKYGTLWGDYTIQANDGGTHKTRLWFSAGGDPRTYDLTNSWQDIPGVIKGVEGIRGAILVWTDHALWRITGTTPPSSGIIGDLDLKQLFDVGLVDERSIATYGGWVIWANAEGIWMTDGASAPRNLTVVGGINNYWRTVMKNYSITSTDYVVSGGIYRGYYLVGVTSSADNVKVMLACDLSTNSWFRISAPLGGPCMFSHAVSGHEDTYWGSTFNGRVVSTASAWEIPSHFEYDNTQGIYGSIETPFFRGFQRFHRKWIPSDAPSVWQRLYLNYDAAVYLANYNAVRIAYTTSPESGAAYTTIGGLPALTAPDRKRIAINPNGGAIPSRGIAFKIDQAQGINTYSADLRINDLELEYFTREGSR